MEEHRLTVFKNRVLRILWPKRDMATGRQKKLNNKEVHDLYFSLNIIRLIIYRRM
jgi:hypothetical protein